MLNSRLAVSIQEAVQGVCAPDGDGLGGGQEGVPSSSCQYKISHEAWEGEDEAVVSKHLQASGNLRKRCPLPTLPGWGPIYGVQEECGGWLYMY